MPYIGRGSVIYDQRLGRKHFGVYLGDGMVMHFNNTDYSYDTIKPIIHKVCLAEFLGLNKNKTKKIISGKDKEFYVLKNDKIVSKYDSSEVVARALKCEGCNYYNEVRDAYEKRDIGYDLFFNNCEHFAMWCLTGEHYSAQTDRLFTANITGEKVKYSQVGSIHKDDLMLTDSSCEKETMYSKSVTKMKDYGNTKSSYGTFRCYKKGEESYAFCETRLRLGERVKINGNENLSDYIRFNDGGCVYSICLVEGESLGFKYTIRVDAEGPHGLKNGSGYLRFYDESGDSYSLKVWTSIRDVHTVSYNSDAPALIRIKWSNKYISK